MFGNANYAKSTFLLAISFALISAEKPPEPPGRGVLCLGTFIYFAEKTGKQCRAGSDPEFQARIANYARRFDDYIIRNTGGDPVVLEKFKDGQNLNNDDHSYICEGDAARTYENFKALEAEKLDGIVDELLLRDGPPSFGDCV